MNTMTHGASAAPLERLMVFTGNANPRLAQDVAKHLNLSLGRAIVGKFSDGEVMVELLENVRGKDRSEEHTSELQSLRHLVCRLLLEKKKKIDNYKGRR